MSVSEFMCRYVDLPMHMSILIVCVHIICVQYTIHVRVCWWQLEMTRGGGLIICFNIIIIIGLQPIFPDKKEHDTVTTYLTCYVNTLIVK